MEPMMRNSSFSALSAAVLALGLTAQSALADPISERRAITVSASGSVEVEPDTARINTGVTTEAETAQEALAENSRVMKEVIAGLKDAGVDAKNIQTSSLHVSPRYTRPERGDTRQIDGYQVTNQVQVVTKDIKGLGEILDKLVTLGANQLGGLSFEASESETLRDKARTEAVANARRRAELFATAAGVELGEVLTISEGGYSGPSPRPMARAMEASAVPIESGTQTLTADVTVTWALK
jgi:uncharacterized protein YggE